MFTTILIIAIAAFIAGFICFVVYSLLVDSSKAKKVIASVKMFFNCDYGAWSDR